MVVLFLSLLIGPIAAPYASLDEQLIALSRMTRDGLTQSAKGYKPKARHYFARRTLLVLARVVVADQAEPRIGRAPLRNELGVSGQLTDGR
jgi:flagellar motor component MotA